MFPKWKSSGQFIFTLLPPGFFIYILSVTHDFGNLAKGITPLQVSATALGKIFISLQKGKGLSYNYSRQRKLAGSNWILGKERATERKWRLHRKALAQTEQETSAYAEHGWCGLTLHRAWACTWTATRWVLKMTNPPN